MRCERRVHDLDRLKARIGDAVEEPLTGAEQDGGEVENELVDHACRSAWRTVDAPPAMSTPRSPAASEARANAASKPSTTK